MAKKEAAATQRTNRTASTKCKLPKYYKGMIALTKDPVQRAVSKKMWVDLATKGLL